MAHRRQLAYWLFTVAGFVVLMVLVGGLTRLTDSGLSITEWQPISGALPPLNAADWEVAFAKYREIPEYQLVNAGMSLEAFKVIYWWEWGHRQLGRVVGLVFFLPFVVFLLQRKIPKPALGPLLALFALGGLQGFMGWYMVQSGLTDRVDVSQYRLAMHLGLALIIFSFCLWMGLHFIRDARLPAAAGPGVALSGTIAVLVLVQSLLGALVAGLDAGTTYTDWPFMDGDVIPSGLFDMSPAVSNLFESHLNRAVQSPFGRLCADSCRYLACFQARAHESAKACSGVGRLAGGGCAGAGRTRHCHLDECRAAAAWGGASTGCRACFGARRHAFTLYAVP